MGVLTIRHETVGVGRHCRREVGVQIVNSEDWFTVAGQPANAPEKLALNIANTF